MQSYTQATSATQLKKPSSTEKSVHDLYQAFCQHISESASEQLQDIKRHAQLTIAKGSDIDADLLCPFAQIALRHRAFILAIQLAEFLAKRHRMHKDITQSYFIRAQARYALGDYYCAYKLFAYLMVRYPEFNDYDIVADYYDRVMIKLANNKTELAS